MSKARIGVAAALLVLAGSAALAARARLLPYWQVRNQESRVELLDAGEGPRRPLTYQPTRAPRSFHSMSQSGVLRVRGVLQHDESYAPPVMARWDAGESTTHFDVTRIEWRLGEARTLADDKVAGEAKGRFDEALRGLADLRLVTFLGPRGQLQIEAPEPLDPVQKRVVDGFVEMFSLQLTVPFPAEPVGRGAMWAVTLDRRFGLADHVQTQVRYRLDDTDGDDGFDVAVKVALTGGPQPAPRAAEHVVVDQIEGSGSGRIVRMRREATPVHSDLVYQIDMSVTQLPEGQSTPTEEQRARGHRVAVRARELMQAADVGPIEWAEDPPEKPLAESGAPADRGSQARR